MNKRMTSSILAIVMLLCMLMPAMPASAAPSAATDSGLIISETALHPDDTFTVSLKIPEIPQKISDATLWVSFASDAFEVTDFTPPMLDNAQRIYSTVSEANAASRLSVVYGSLDYEQSIPFPAYMPLRSNEKFDANWQILCHGIDLKDYRRMVVEKVLKYSENNRSTGMIE